MTLAYSSRPPMRMRFDFVARETNAMSCSEKKWLVRFVMLCRMAGRNPYPPRHDTFGRCSRRVTYVASQRRDLP